LALNLNFIINWAWRLRLGYSRGQVLGGGSSWLALLGALSCSAVAAAQEQEEEQDASDVVVTGTRTPEAEQKATVRTDRVDRREAERRGATSVGEALQGQLGVQVNPSAYGFLGNPSAIQIQGLDRERVLVLEDGERVIGGRDGAIDLAQIPMTDVEAIELVTGPTSSLYGTSAIGGVVNILTGPPRRLGPSGRVRAEGRHPWGALGQGNAFYRSGPHWVGVDASAQYGAAIKLRDDLPDAVPERSQYLLGLRAGTALGPVGLMLKARFIRDHSLGHQSEVVPGLGTYAIDLPEETDRFTLHLAETLRLGGGSTLRLSAARQWVFGDSITDRVDSPLDQTRERDGLLQSAEIIATIADGDRTWVVGTRAEVEEFEQSLERIEPIGGQIVATHIEEVQPTTLGSGALYGQLSWRLHDVITVLGGVRGEIHLQHGAVAAPRLAVAVHPSEWLTLRASAGRGFRAPSARELGFSFDHTAAGYRVIGNPDLEPETSWGTNADATVAFDRFQLRAGAYVNWIEDLIDIDYLAPGPGGVEDYGYQNIAEARTFGGQLDLLYWPATWLKTECGYAYTWTRDDTREMPLVGRPPHTVYAAAHAELPLGFELTLRQRVVTDAFIDEQTRTPGFGLVDVRVAKGLWPSAKAYLGVLNLGGAQKDPDRYADQRPLAGRIFYLGLTADIPPESESDTCELC
jgi:outer membrane receptor for ferrienterochelin and colicins